MTTFNFTVRATDSRGAFSDRAFSIKVRNTIIDRFALAGQDGHIYTSVDGTTWTARLNQGIQFANGAEMHIEMVHGNGRWLMPKNNSTYRMSFDGVTWTDMPLPVNTRFTPGGTAATQMLPIMGFGNGKFVMTYVADLDNGATQKLCFFTSTDGINWTNPATTVAGVAQNFLMSYPNTTGIASYFTGPAPVFGNGMWLVTLPNNGNVTYFTSTDDGVTWIQRAFPTDSNPPGSITFANGLWILTRRIGNAGATSNDGIVWNQMTFPALPSFNGIGKVIYGNGRLVAFPHKPATGSTSGSTDRVYTSTDGSSWSGVILPQYIIGSAFTQAARISATYHNGVFYFGASNTGNFYSSEDGLTWNLITLPTNVFGLTSLNQD